MAPPHPDVSSGAKTLLRGRVDDRAPRQRLRPFIGAAADKMVHEPGECHEGNDCYRNRDDNTVLLWDFLFDSPQSGFIHWNG